MISIVPILAVWLLFSAVIAWLAGQRGRDAGSFFVLSLLLSPVVAGIALIALPPRTSGGDGGGGDTAAAWQAYQAHKRRQAEEAERAAPPGAEMRLRVARGGEDLGSFPLSQIRAAITSGELAPTDHWWDAAGKCWQELDCLDVFFPA